MWVPRDSFLTQPQLIGPQELKEEEIDSGL